MSDPAVQAVADALEAADVYDRVLPAGQSRYDADAQVAVDAYRRKVLASRPDAERWEGLRSAAEIAGARPAPQTRHLSITAAEMLDLLAALADAEAARQAADSWESQ